jgi:uncharacterized protein YjbI with pentapeptide repeats
MLSLRCCLSFGAGDFRDASTGRWSGIGATAEKRPSKKCRGKQQTSVSASSRTSLGLFACNVEILQDRKELHLKKEVHTEVLHDIEKNALLESEQLVPEVPAVEAESPTDAAPETAAVDTKRHTDNSSEELAEVEVEDAEIEAELRMETKADMLSRQAAEVEERLRELAAEVTAQHELQDSEPASPTASLSLLDLAEVLDLHRTWVETYGEAGSRADLSGANLAKADLTGVNLQGASMHRANLSGADLSMANLRGASLVQADLSDTILLGTELSGANLMGANLYGAEGVWVGRLGGTNLFDAILPETVASFDSSKAIGHATQAARWFYFLMISASALCALLIVFTSDTRLIMNASAIPISRLGNLLPMEGFYLGGPLVLFAIYLRFHFLLLRLWGSMAALPATFQDGQTLEKDGPWYLMGMVRKHFRWSRDSRSSIGVLESVVATALAYWVVPATLFLFWLRYLVLQDFRGTLLQAVLVTLASAAATGVPTIVARVLRPGDLLRHSSRNLMRGVFKTTRAALVAGCVLLLLSIGVIRGLPADRDAVPGSSSASMRRWAAEIFQAIGYRPYADLTETTLSPLPNGQNWSEEGLSTVQGARLNQVDLRFARGYRAFLVNARLWRANLQGAYLSEADLHGANLREVILRDAVLDRAQLGHATLVSVDATNANLASADLHDADLSYGNFQNASLSNAKLPGASLYGVNLRDAQLLRADLSHTDLRDTKLEQSTLSFSNLQQADLSSAKMGRANLAGAIMKGTILLDADLKNADLGSAVLSGALLRGADITGANLAGADLRGATGLTTSQICSAHWGGALLDDDLQTAVQAQCHP